MEEEEEELGRISIEITSRQQLLTRNMAGRSLSHGRRRPAPTAAAPDGVTADPSR